MLTYHVVNPEDRFFPDKAHISHVKSIINSILKYFNKIHLLMGSY